MKLKKMAAATALLAMSAVALAGCGKKSDDEKVVILYPGEEANGWKNFWLIRLIRV